MARSAPDDDKAVAGRVGKPSDPKHAKIIKALVESASKIRERDAEENRDGR